MKAATQNSTSAQSLRPTDLDSDKLLQVAIASSSRRTCRTPRKASADITTLPRKSAIGPKGMNGKNGFSRMNRAARLARMAQARADVAPVQRPAGKALVTPPEALDEERPIARARAGGIALRCV